MMGKAKGKRQEARGIRQAQVPWAFTLIELVVVMAIVLVLLGLVLPSASKMWENRKVADAENIIQGMLVTTRARAQRPNATETGLFFYLDRSGAQQIVTIEQVTPEAANCTKPPNQPDPAHNREAWLDVFRIADESPLALPPPMRVVPRYVVDPLAQGGDSYYFDDDELQNSNFENPYSTAHNAAQRHRNFFTIIFDHEGRLLVWRPVFILDYNLVEDDPPAINRGDVSGLPVGTGFDAYGNGGGPNVSQFDDLQTGQPKRYPGTGGQYEEVCYLVIDPDNAADPLAINFPSVDGLLVYDDSGFVEAGDPAAKREYLLRFAQPFYVNRLTGAVIRGPLGENF